MSAQQEKIRKQVREILENSPKGIRYTDLVRSINEALPDIKINTIHGTMWNLKQKIDKGEVKDIVAPERGLYILQKYFQKEEY
jgi:ribosomal protein S3AE